MTRTIAVAVTIGRRQEGATVYDYFPRSLSSLRAAGFTQPVHAFVEPGAEQHLPADAVDLVPHHNAEKLGCFPNFKQGLHWLLDNTDADWLLMLQDDAVWRADGAAVLQAAVDDDSHQDVGFLSPYTSKSMVSVPLQRKPPKQQRWVDCKFYNNSFWGAVAMCFPRAGAVRMVEESRRFRQHTHHRKLDVVVGNAMRDLKLRMLVSVPSLVDHIGSWSTLGRHRFKGNQWGRRGFGFRQPS